MEGKKIKGNGIVKDEIELEKERVVE